MRKFLTPEQLTSDRVCRLLIIPADVDWLSLVNGVLSELIHDYNYEQLTPTDVSELETANLFQEMFLGYLEGTVCMIGAIILFATGDAPAGTLPCDGSTYQRVDYPRLYSVLNTIYHTDADHFVTPAPVGFTGLNYRIVFK